MYMFLARTDQELLMIMENEYYSGPAKKNDDGSWWVFLDAPTLRDARDAARDALGYRYDASAHEVKEA